MLLLAGCSKEQRVEKLASKEQGQVVDPRARVLLKQAHEALAAREFESALASVHQVDRIQANLPEAQFIRGHVALAMYKYADARDAFQRILSRHPKYEAAWHSLGDVAYAEGNYREALRYYRREEAINPTPQTLFNVGNAYRMLESPDSAAVAYDASAELDRSYAPAYHARAELLELEGRYEEALPLARRAAEISPMEPRYQYLLGQLLYRTGRLDDAEGTLRKAAERAPWDYSTLYALGQVLQRQGRQVEATEMLTRAEEARSRETRIRDDQRRASMHRDSALAHVALAEEFIRSGRVDEALERFHLALAIDPNNLSVRQNIASISLARGEVEEAVAHCTRIVETDSSRVGAWVILSAAYAQLGRRTEAEYAWKQAISIDPNHPTVQQVLRVN